MYYNGGDDAYGASGSGGGLTPGFDFQTALAQLLQQGPQTDQTMLNATMSDLDSQQGTALNALKNRFSGLGRSTLSSEYASQEDQTMKGFEQARKSAQVAANQSGQNRFSLSVSPLMQLLQLMQQQNQFDQSLAYR
jgi:hypothetical protein